MLFSLGQEKQGINFRVKDGFMRWSCLVLIGYQEKDFKKQITKCIFKLLSSAFCIKSIQEKMCYSFEVPFLLWIQEWISVLVVFLSAMETPRQ